MIKNYDFLSGKKKLTIVVLFRKSDLIIDGMIYRHRLIL